MNIEDLRSQAEDLYFAALSNHADAATKKEIRDDYNRFSDKISGYVCRGEMNPKIGQKLLQIAAPEGGCTA
jgi:hypothetical protein